MTSVSIQIQHPILCGHGMKILACPGNGHGKKAFDRAIVLSCISMYS